MYNPETYGWYQCDEEDYDSSASPEEQMLDAMRAEVAKVPSYCERYARAKQDEEELEQAENDWSGGFGEQAYQDSLM